jgi:hypothetical protein
MDLRLYLRVIWRFRIIVALGLILATVMAVLSFVQVSLNGGLNVSYRQAQDWQATETYLVSGQGFAVGSVFGAGGSKSPLTLAGLSAFYSQIVMSDAVRRLMLKDGPIDGVVSATPGVDNVTTIRAPLPLVSISGDATTPAKAVLLTRRAARAFKEWVTERQNAAAIPDSQRITFPVVNAARDATLVGPRKKTLPIVIFLTILTATIGLAFILENLRPRVRPVSTMDDEESKPTRRSA